MKMKYLFLVTAVIFAMGAACQKEATVIDSSSSNNLQPIQECVGDVACFDQCATSEDAENCYVNILTTQTEDFCQQVKAVDLCKDFYLLQNVKLDSDCASIKTGIWKVRCAESFADTQTLFNEADFDGDGLSNQKENELGTDFRKFDTDGDGYSDYEEVQAEYDPLTAN